MGKKIVSNCLVFAVAVIIGIATMSCTVGVKPQTTQWEYRMEYFDRDAGKEFGKKLAELGVEGWEYAGPLCNDGINAQVVAFKRPLKKK
jgi:hypothetical protein